MNEIGPLRPLPPADRRLVNAVCHRFEAAWKADSEPSLEDYLGELPEHLWDAARDELIDIELGQRKRRLGRLPTDEEAAALHPDISAQFLRLLRQRRAAEAAGDEVFHRASLGSLGLGDVIPWDGRKRFLVQRKFPRGGQAVAYLAKDTLFDEEVVVKVSRTRSPEAGEEVCGFLEEARALARFRGTPHVLGLIDYGAYAGFPCVVTRYVKGDDVAVMYRARPAEPHRAASIVATLARAVAAVHAEGLTHRDITPNNVRLDTKGEPVLLDFGLARIRMSWSEAAAEKNDDGYAFGTPGFMAPEQVAGRNSELDQRTDVFGLGGVLFFLLTSRPPCPNFPSTEVDGRRLEGGGHHATLTSICLRALEVEPNRRYQTASEMADDLERWLGRFQDVPTGKSDPIGLDASSVTLPPTVLFGTSPASPRRENTAHHKFRRARGRYLNDLKRQLKTLLAGMLHNALHLDLQLTPVEDVLWSYSYPRSNDPGSARSLFDAFEACERRLLLLGRPGGGKSTSLMQLGLQLVEEAEAEPDGPIPLIVNLSDFQSYRESRRKSYSLGFFKLPDNETLFEDWLCQRWATFPGTKRFARKWLRSGQAAFLLDGLDEVSEEARADMIALVNDAVIDQYPNSPVVLCSRLQEFRQLAAGPAPRSKLYGSLCLNPLTSEQITSYLEHASADGLLTAVRQDRHLSELAKTPLILGMMTLAYRNVPAADVPRLNSRAELRRRLMQDYVCRAQQRVERRRRGSVCDNDPRRDVPPQEYRYSPDAVDRYLGWIAERLGRRMQATASLESFDELLEPLQGQRGAKPDRLLAITFRLPLSVLFLLAVTAPATASSVEGAAATLAHVAAIAIAGTAVMAVAASTRHVAFEFLIYILGTSFVWLGAISVTLSHWLPFGLDPAAIAVVLWAYALSTTYVALRDTVDLKAVRPTYPAIGSVVLTALFAVLPDWLRGNGTTLAVSLLLLHLAWCILVKRLRNVTQAGMAAAVTLAGSVFSWAAAAAFEATGSALLPAFFFVCLQFAIAAGALAVELPVIVAVTAAASYAGGLEAAVLACSGAILAYMAGIIFLTESTATANSSAKLLLGRLYSPEVMRRALSRFFWTPALRVLLAATGRFPLRARPFVEYGCQALLLQRADVGGRKPREFSFVHRLVRDFFALRRVSVALDSSNRSERFAAIRELATVGDAATDLLFEIFDRGDVGERVEAIKALGTTPSPEVSGLFMSAVTDPQPLVRKAVLLNSALLPDQGVKTLLLVSREDRDLRVQLARLVLASGSKLSEAFPQATPDKAWRRREPQHARSATTAREVADACMEGGIGDVLGALREDEDFRVRVCAARVLGLVRDREATDVLIDALGDPCHLVGLEACLALGNIGDRLAVKFLAERIGRGGPLAAFAAMALGELGDDRARDVLVRSRYWADTFMQHAIDRAIAKLNRAR